MMIKHFNKQNVAVALATCVVLCSAVSADAEMRTWKAANGETVKAEYVKHHMGKIVLKKENGKQISVPPEFLSPADRAYAEKQNPPEIKIEFKKKTQTKAHDYDDVQQRVSCVVKIEKTSKQPYSGKLKVEVYVLGEDLSDGTITMLGTQEWKDVTLPNKRGEEIELNMKVIKLDFDKNGVKYGEEFYGYALFVFDESGRVLESKTSKKILLEKLDALRKQDMDELQF